jgi:hypothetical protein
MPSHTLSRHLRISQIIGAAPIVYSARQIAPPLLHRFHSHGSWAQNCPKAREICRRKCAHHGDRRLPLILLAILQFLALDFVHPDLSLTMRHLSAKVVLSW